MNLLIPIIILVIFIFVVFALSNRRKTVVLGTEMANANEAEQKRLREGNYGVSPMPKENYGSWPSERHFYNPIFNSLDTALLKLSNDFEKNELEQKSKIRMSISMADIYVLLTFSNRASIFAIRRKSTDILKGGINAIAMIEAERCDFRDILISLSLLYYAAERLGIDANDLFQATAKNSESKTAELLIGFTKRSRIDRDIEKSWGFYPVETINGIGFLQTNYKKYAPKKPLHEIMIKISELLVSDKYATGVISVGTEIAGIWLSSNDNTEFSKGFKNLNGCASLSSSPKDSTDENNILLIYLAEFDGKSAVDNLYNTVLNQKKKDFSRIMIKSNNLLCIIIGRSIMVGVKAVETDESLKRFEKPIKKLIDEVWDFRVRP